MKIGVLIKRKTENRKLPYGWWKQVCPFCLGFRTGKNKMLHYCNSGRTAIKWSNNLK